MNFIKTSLFATTSVLVLAACGSSVAPVVSSPIENIDTIPLKTAPLNDAQYERWGAADLITDTIPGMSVDKAYAEILNKRKGQTVIVGVIDSGVDIEHEDLRNVIWTNDDEIAGNNIDDDNNGYIDDMHGWNFLGNIVEENMEYVRFLKKLGPKYDGKSEASISAANRKEYALYKKAKAEYEKEYQQAMAQKTQYEQILQQLKPAHQAMSEKLGTADYSAKDLAAIENPTATEQQQIAMLNQMLNFGDSVPEVLKELKGGIDYFGARLNSHFNLEKDFRSTLGDDPDDLSDTGYGNNDVDGPDVKKEDARHGTHVSGIIAGERNNDIGIDGVAQNVEIMVLRAVPDGDEYDKDIALALRYAADNGAKVVNTSFGKYYSAHPEWVREAISYAASKDVLIINAAGNEGLDLDTTEVYPNDQTLTGAEYVNNVLTVGALSYKYGEEMVAPFSNYGDSNVDVFAPGVKIWATTPLNTYEFLQGTSMAAPAVAGVAATIRSYYPSLTAVQVKQIIMDSGLTSNSTVVLGGDSSNTEKFGAISKSGKMVNMYNALIMADRMARSN
ncbi:MAG: peptidase S8 [Flavobacteriaceae bacterium]|nr:peptidase S8 [Flavobacteriaceae bacterium]